MTEEASVIETKKNKNNLFQQLDVFTNIQMFVKKKNHFYKNHFYCHTFSAFQYSVNGFEPIIMLSMRCQSFSSLQLKKVRTKQLLISSILCSRVNSNLS